MAFVSARWAPDYVGTDGQGGGRQIPRARCAWMCFHVCRKCLTPGPLLTSNLGCQRHFLECPVKINMWTETRGLHTPAWWTGEPSWHLCPATPFASYPNVRLYKIKGFFLSLSITKAEWMRALQFVYTARAWELEIKKVFTKVHPHQQVCLCSAFMFWVCVSLCAKKKPPPGLFLKVVNSSTSSFCHQRERGLALTLKPHKAPYCTRVCLHLKTTQMSHFTLQPLWSLSQYRYHL